MWGGGLHNSFDSTRVNKLTRIKDCELVGHVACTGKVKDTDENVTGGTWKKLSYIGE